mmetsp:Transcript_34761/g.56302  ORF Transcript_34761/g.56302 Transcript_34761/m.56302 type:complete len:156 (+) Transcript_34761:119-586(+)
MAIRLIDLRPTMKQITCVFIVLEKGAITRTKDDHSIHHALVADTSACVNLSLWDSQGEQLQPGDIVRMKGGYTSLFKGSLVISSGKFGTLERIGEFCMLFTENPNLSTWTWVQDQDGSSRDKFRGVPPGAPNSSSQVQQQLIASQPGPPPKRLKT